MASNPSLTNFAQLFTQGLQRGLGDFRQQQTQQADLMLTLQNMLAQQAGQMRQDFRQRQAQELERSQFRFAQTQAGIENAFKAQDARRKAQESQSLVEQRAAYAQALKGLAEKRKADVTKDKLVPASVFAKFHTSYDQLVKQYNQDLMQYSTMSQFMPEEMRAGLIKPTPPPARDEYIKQQVEVYNQSVLGEGGGLDALGDDVLMEMWNSITGGSE